jgi:hypothetical protein
MAATSVPARTSKWVMNLPTKSKQPFKFQPWMAGAVIVPFALFMIGRGLLLQGSVELGQECSNRDECKAPADACLRIEGRGVCSVICTDSCPNGLSCVEMDVSMNTGVGFNELKDIRYCLPADLADR